MPGTTLNILCEEKKTRKKPAMTNTADPIVRISARPREYVFLTVTML